MNVEQLRSSLERFIRWLDGFGEISYDHQSFYASALGRKAKALYYRKPALGILAVAPMVFSEAFTPWARRFFWHPQRLPIADAHYAMGFAFLAEVLGDKKLFERTVHFLDVLEETRCPDFENYCWGYPFDWETKYGTIPQGTPLITTTPYAYEAFLQAYLMEKNDQWYRILQSIAEHAVVDIKDYEVSPGATTCSYTPSDEGGVINAAAYRAFLLTSASKHLSVERYLKTAEGNVNFVLKAQHSNGSWPYSIDGDRGFVDHFHTCFVLKALAKIEQMTGSEACRRAIESGVQYYVRNLFDEKGRAKPFSKTPRLTVYRNELYDYAECINLGVLLKGRFPELDGIVENIVADLLTRWQKPDGSFRSRKLYLGWDNVPMHRWAQSQIFRSLSFLLKKEIQKG